MGKLCIVCNKPFTSTNPRRLVCSSDCRHKRNVEHQRRYYGYQTGRIPCRICGEVFNAEHNRKVCSDECRKQSRRNAQRKQRQNEAARGQQYA